MKKDTSELVLLDANVLLALAWPSHQFYASAIRRLDVPEQRWATCAITQLAFIRLSANPAAVQSPVTPVAAAALLAEMVRDTWHVYLEMSPQPSEMASAFAGLQGHKQVTDSYLVAFAKHHGAKLLTLDARLRGRKDVEVLV